ncbi:MAG: relaxase/mobilization nuclease domain-containing protein [Nitrospiraceae bacterium]
MIGKVPKPGRGFRGLVNYLLRGEHSAEPGANRWPGPRFANLLVDDPEQVPHLMRMTASRSRRVKSPVYHLVISWHKNEAPSDDLMRAVARTTCEDIGLAEHQRLTIAHNDTAHRHVHIVVNRVHPETGIAWNRRQDYVVIEQSLKRQAESYGLEFVPGRHNTTDKRREQRRRPSDGSYRKARNDKLPARTGWSRERIQAERDELAAAIEAARSWDDLDTRLAQKGLTLEGKGQGIVITDGTSDLKLSALTKDIRKQKLEDRFKEDWGTFAKRTGDRRERGRSTEYEALAQAQGQADMAFSLYKAGLVSRKQLARSVRDRDLAQEEVDQDKSLAEKLNKDLGEALRGGERSEGKPVEPPAKRAERGRRRDRDR